MFHSAIPNRLVYCPLCPFPAFLDTIPILHLKISAHRRTRSQLATDQNSGPVLLHNLTFLQPFPSRPTASEGATTANSNTRDRR